MKKIRYSIMSFLLLLPMIAGLMGTTTVQADEVVDDIQLVLHKYAFDYGDEPANHRADQAFKDGEGTPLAGVKFTVVPVTDKEAQTFNASDDKRVYGDKLVAAAKHSIVSPATDATGQTMVTVANDGRYLIVETDSPDQVIKAETIPVLIALPTHALDGAKITGTLELYLKNQTQPDVMWPDTGDIEDESDVAPANPPVQPLTDDYGDALEDPSNTRDGQSVAPAKSGLATLFPKTGGINTVIFAIAGLVIMGIAFTLIKLSKKKA
ncbi:LPXTG cell wall anchor domain-containing protein [Periweissella cryptocerci]|uniref:LPXTG cell wall anchor domain-containing protein n=1 Tax=Periweissella cryptocerci TaxID=2506420 RepID=A0A4P6YXB6_9LACO|nr:pilin N-terminal domain-containing protein [Periweissella cryptocerci]QBO37457.1 LPXTG cell wall anchor domain-containing protein [Periweissella cryptocerci]